MCRRRPYRVECTGSLSTSEVKQHRARLVLGWGTAWEDLWVLSACCATKNKVRSRHGWRGAVGPSGACAGQAPLPRSDAARFRKQCIRGVPKRVVRGAAHARAHGTKRQTRLTRPAGEAADARGGVRRSCWRARKVRTGRATSERGDSREVRERKARLAGETRRAGEETAAVGERLGHSRPRRLMGPGDARGEAKRRRMGVHQECFVGPRPPPAEGEIAKGTFFKMVVVRSRSKQNQQFSDANQSQKISLHKIVVFLCLFCHQTALNDAPIRQNIHKEYFTAVRNNFQEISCRGGVA